MNVRKKFVRVDWPVFLLVLALCGAGLLNVYSGTRVFPSSGISLFYKQMIWILLGMTVFFVFCFLSKGFIEEVAWYVFFAVVAVLLVVLLIGKVRGGAQRWLSLGIFTFQPSEFAKIALILALASYFSRRYSYEGIGFRDLAPAVGITLIPFLLVALQPDLGTAGVFLIILGAMMVIACVRAKVFVLVGAAGAVAVPGLWLLMKNYQKQRVLTFLDPGRDPLGAGYHVIQSKIAVGSGGLLGKGYLHGTQGSLRFLPEQHTDFAFAVFSEEWGFVGSMVLLLLFLALVYRMYYLASQSQDRFASFACGGLASYFLAHIVINIAMVCGLFPVVGIPLPFVSYGGSSMLTNMMALGILANLSRTRFTFQTGKEKSLSV
jgi:rod shape determining protein RodA